MSESEHKVKVEDVPILDGIHVWYSEVEKVILVRLNKAKWIVDEEPEGDHVHIHKKRD